MVTESTNAEADRIFDHYDNKGISRQEFRKRYNAAKDLAGMDKDMKDIMQRKAIVRNQKAQIDRATQEN